MWEVSAGDADLLTSIPSIPLAWCILTRHKAKIVVSCLRDTQQKSEQCQVCNYVVRFIIDRL